MFLQVRVAVFATGEAADKATEAGADIVGAEDLLASVMEGDSSVRLYTETSGSQQSPSTSM